MQIRVEYKAPRVPVVDDFVLLTRKDNSQVPYTIKEIRMFGRAALVLLPLGTSDAESWYLEYPKEPNVEQPTGDQLLKKVRESLKEDLLNIDIADKLDTALLLALEKEHKY